MSVIFTISLLLAFLAPSKAFHLQLPVENTSRRTTLPTLTMTKQDNDHFSESKPSLSSRRSVLASAILSAAGGILSVIPTTAHADDDFASIAARASKIQTDLSKDTSGIENKSRSDKTAYDFTLPIEGNSVPFKDVIKQQISEEYGASVKAIVVVNIKQDDPVARKTIPELIALAAKYGRGDNPSLVVVISPTDQGYYEPDTSQLIRLKLASEYGYGINPSTVLTDKVNLLGTGAHPFWRWLQSNCRTPAGIGRIEGNFEKFLIDGRTGQPLRRYPRKYSPLSMEDDIEAVIAGRSLPPARANWQEEWREAAADAKANTYRFEKGLNYFDQ
jgi:glutathione peroxidase